MYPGIGRVAVELLASILKPTSLSFPRPISPVIGRVKALAFEDKPAGPEDPPDGSAAGRTPLWFLIVKGTKPFQAGITFL